MMSDTLLASSDDASISDCQAYLKGFRVDDLKELLKFFGCGHTGRKGDLYNRSVELLKNGNPKVRKKIKEIGSHKAARGGYHFMKKKAEAQLPPAPVLPSVVLKEAAFYERISTISGPVDLVNCSPGLFPCFMRLQFPLTLQHMQLLFPSGPSGSSQHPQVIVRFCKKDSTYPQDDYYPPQCSLKVNDTPCPIPGYHPLKPEPKSDAMKTCSPVNITHYLKSSGTLNNTVAINWCQSFYSQFCVTVELSRPLTVQNVLQKLISKGSQSSSVTQSLVKQKLSTSKDSDVSATTSNLRVSLLCPLGRMRMEHPCRSENCSHLQCFDAKTFLQMNEKKAKWMCPVCDKSAHLETLMIDSLFQSICDTSPTDDVEFTSDGKWCPVHKHAKMCATPERNCIVLSSSYVSKVKDEKDVTTEPVTIDLTQSDDEDGSPVSHASSDLYSPHRLYVGSSPAEGGVHTRILPVYMPHLHSSSKHLPVHIQNKGSCSTPIADVNKPVGSLTSSLVTRASSGVVSVD